MKRVIDERLKYRLVGVAVILSLGAIFLPALMRESNHHIENNFSVKVRLPPKPSAPNVVVTDKEHMFKTIKVTRIVRPSDSYRKNPELAKDDFISPVPIAHETISLPVSTSRTAQKPLELALNNAVKSQVTKQPQSIKKAQVIRQAQLHKVNSIKKITNTKMPVIKKPVIATRVKPQGTLNKKEMYAVQLASFSRVANAQSLVNKLQKMGYRANYVKINVRNGIAYKVYAGHSPDKSEVMRMRIQLASAVRLNGFVVNTGVS